MPNLDSLSESEILGLTIIGEARGEPIEGQVAVGCVIRNRAVQNKTSFSHECLKPKQFSCWNEDDPNLPFLEDLAARLTNGQFIDDPYLIQCMFIADGIVEQKILDNTHHSLNYMTIDLFESSKKPSWAENTTHQIEIGRQVFFTAV